MTESIRKSSDNEQMEIELDENFEEFFEQDVEFIQDLKRSYSDIGLKFQHNKAIEKIEPLIFRKKSNNFLQYIKDTIIPISTRLDQNYNCYYPSNLGVDIRDANTISKSQLS